MSRAEENKNIPGASAPGRNIVSSSLCFYVAVYCISYCIVLHYFGKIIIIENYFKITKI